MLLQRNYTKPNSPAQNPSKPMALLVNPSHHHNPSRKSTHIKQKKGKFPRTLSVSRHSSIPAPIEKKSKRFNFQPSKLRKTTKIYKNPNPSLSLTLSVIVNPILFSLCIYLLI